MATDSTVCVEEVELKAVAARREALKAAVRTWLPDAIDRYAVARGIPPDAQLSWPLFQDMARFIGGDIGLVAAEVLAEAWEEDLP